MEHMTVKTVVTELNNRSSFDEALELGKKVKRAIRAGKNTPFLPMDVFDEIEDSIKARTFMMGVICN
ncbi:hypothetical protein [Amphritea sp.]|uniref:hypothetical protein n=1 Tax=Amphritea sp. TaxID=1872502 RepID=UPI0025BE26EE|nr:hypothetical protein [Amphritea sp.]